MEKEISICHDFQSSFSTIIIIHLVLFGKKYSKKNLFHTIPFYQQNYKIHPFVDHHHHQIMSH